MSDGRSSQRSEARWVAAAMAASFAAGVVCWEYSYRSSVHQGADRLVGCAAWVVLCSGALAWALKLDLRAAVLAAFLLVVPAMATGFLDDLYYWDDQASSSNSIWIRVSLFVRLGLHLAAGRALLQAYRSVARPQPGRRVGLAAAAVLLLLAAGLESFNRYALIRAPPFHVLEQHWLTLGPPLLPEQDTQSTYLEPVHPVRSVELDWLGRPRLSFSDRPPVTLAMPVWLLDASSEGTQLFLRQPGSLP